MGKRDKDKSQISVPKREDEDDDDAEANEDLSLKIVEKARMRNFRNANSGAGDGVAHRDADFEAEIVTNLKDAKREKKEKKVTKTKKAAKIEAEINSVISSEKDAGFENFCSDLFLVDGVKEVVNLEGDKAAEIVNEALQTNPVEMSDNTVLRKLLRGPRYFDPPDSGWSTCYNCGEEGHMAANCTSARRKKPCFVCGSLEHNAKQCTKGKACFICKRGGHRAKDCPEKDKGESQNYKTCLRCGDSGHEMFSCRNDYCSNDLKEIQCYICGNSGHLCCVNYTDTGPREVSCYKCGLSGHTGLACAGSQAEISGSVSVSSCFKCGEVGHFARECINSTKVGKRNRELSTPKKRTSKEKRNHSEVKSAPHDLGKGNKKRKNKYEGGYASASQPKQRHGWITEDPGDFRNGQAYGGWRSPATPNNWRTNFAVHESSSHSPRHPRKLNFNNSSPNGSTRFYQPRFSTSRFGNNSSSGVGRDYWR